ncbi:MAG TPA: hypothetical protein VFW78_08545 [Bacteroidia bacterium]|nr:hypothetical protein [Bacteroidia bacterium]
MDTIYRFIYKNDKPALINAVGGLIFLFALVKLMYTPVYGIVMTAISVGLFAYQSGIEIDFKNKKYRLTTHFGPQVFGTWTDFPEWDYISLFKTNMIHTATGYSGASVSRKSSLIQVSLVTKAKKKIKVFESKEPDESISTSKYFAESLDWIFGMPPFGRLIGLVQIKFIRKLYFN